jgi:regulatory protein
MAGDDELVQATTLWRRRFGAPPADEREKARQARYLVARGYSMSVVLRMLRAVTAGSVDSND